MYIDFDIDVSNWSNEELYNTIFSRPVNKELSLKIMNKLCEETIENGTIQRYIEFNNYVTCKESKKNKYFKSPKIINALLTFTLSETNRQLYRRMDSGSISFYIESWKQCICSIAESRNCSAFYISLEHHKDGIPHFHVAMTSYKYPTNFANRILKNIRKKYGNFDISINKWCKGLDGAIKYISKETHPECIKD